MAKRALVPHPDAPHPDFAAACKVSRLGRDVFKLEYVVVGLIPGIRLPPTKLPDRIDGLWGTTCFEAFFAKPNGSYVEFNFAPSREWASYRFDGYRDGIAPAIDLPAPDIFVELDELRFALTAFVEFPPGEIDVVGSMGLAAVIEGIDGTKSYWALVHPAGAPDFHHPTCFAATLPAPDRP